MISLAFKIAALTDSSWSKAIAAASHSKYSHVEGWLSGAQNNALCFSAREPKGCSYAAVDLTTPEWEIVPLKLSDMENLIIRGFCMGADGKDYDFPGLAGYELGTGLHSDSDLFCSECWATALRDCANWDLLKDPWMISPGDLYNLAVAKK